MPETKRRILFIGEQPDLEIFAMLGGEGYEVAALESPHRAKDVFPLYKPHLIIVFLRYPQETLLLDECLAMAGTVPVIAAISLLAKPPLVKAVKAKAAAFFVLPVKPQTVRETLGDLLLAEEDEEIRSAEKELADDNAT